MLKHVRVFVAEDEPMTAAAIVMSIEDAQGEVIGPCASVREALDILRVGPPPTAAILDVQLKDGAVTAVAERLMDLGVPMVFHSGVGIPAALRARDPNLSLCAKPMDPARVVQRLENVVTASRAGNGASSAV